MAAAAPGGARLIPSFMSATLSMHNIRVSWATIYIVVGRMSNIAIINSQLCSLNLALSEGFCHLYSGRNLAIANLQ
jgi:hypothetical protein